MTAWILHALRLFPRPALWLLLLTLALPAQAVQPDEILADPALESRAREISTGLRCLVLPEREYRRQQRRPGP